MLSFRTSDKVAATKTKTTKVLLTDKQIMSVTDFRKLTGKATSGFTDEQVREIIQQLDFLADLYFKSVPAESEQPM